ncbi:MAG: DUF370 domain-containing protein [Thermodesulfovibrionales bacterium]|nr:DUF370 domain-containing protein [Thermodesulfovibrionales bacterium]
MKKGAGHILVNIGFGNVVSAQRVVAIVSPDSSPMKRLREEAKKKGKLIDATEGRKTRAIIITDSDHVILSALQTETITQRFSGDIVEQPSDNDYAYREEASGGS